MNERWFTNPADLGPEQEWRGNVVRPVMREHVHQVWRDGEIVEETREVKPTGKLALVVGR